MKVSNVGLSNIGSSLNKVDSSKTEKSDENGMLDNVSVGKGNESVKGSDKLELSERAQRMNTAKEIASNDSIDEAKVARLQKMIDEGSYQVDAASIADRLVDEHLIMPE